MRGVVPQPNRHGRCPPDQQRLRAQGNNSPKETKVGRAKVVVEIPSGLYRMIIPARRLNLVVGLTECPIFCFGRWELGKYGMTSHRLYRGEVI